MGVHATGHMAHLDVPEKFDANRLMTALNALTAGHPVTIREARRVPDEAHARFSATGRRYHYAFLPAGSCQPSIMGGSGITVRRWRRADAGGGGQACRPT